MEWCSLPVVSDINFKSRHTTEATHCFDRVELRRVPPILDFHKGIVKRCSIVIISLIDVNSQIYQLLFRLERGISCCATHVHSVVEAVSLMVVKQIDICLILLHKFINLFPISPNQSIFQSIQATGINLINTRTKIKELPCLLKLWVPIEV